jgi:hypothetical protein
MNTQIRMLLAMLITPDKTIHNKGLATPVEALSVKISLFITVAIIT